MPGRLVGKVAIVTGAGTSGPGVGEGVGVGKAVSILFAQEGARLVLVDRVEDRVRETLRRVEEVGGEGMVVLADVGDPADCQRVVDAARAQFGTVDILVNNAAVASMDSLLDISHERFQQVVDVNLGGAFMLCKSAVPVMIEHGGGAIVNITSVAAIRGAASQPAYAATKAALLGLMINIACSYGPQGIRINSISPGHVSTPMRDASAAEVGIDPATIDMGHRTALGFEGDAWDIARAALFLASPDARYITGVHLPVDGGATLRMA